MVRSTADSGMGSLRQAILDANALVRPVTIRFASDVFGKPQRILLESPLPAIRGELTIDGYIPDRLWTASGVTIDGADRHRGFVIEPTARVTIASLSVAHGDADDGGGIVNFGHLVLRGVTLEHNRVRRSGGGLANLGGTVHVINSTLAGNRAVQSGGGIANLAGQMTVTNTTLAGNGSAQGGGLYSGAPIRIANTILANSEDGLDCFVAVALDAASDGNLIESHTGCGRPVSTADPRLEALGYYNGPTRTLPPGHGSPAVNLGVNELAVDVDGEPLVWDQRGNGDPRFVAGFTDIGAFERQAFAELTVDTIEDGTLRACSRGAPSDCTLRGAIDLANASAEPDVIRFDPRVFAGRTALRLESPLPEVGSDLTLDARGTGGVTIATTGNAPALVAATGVTLRLADVQVLP